MKEMWKDIPMYKGEYQASDMGRIKSVETGEIIPQRDNGYGYQTVYLGKSRKEYVHRMVGWAFIPNPDNKPQIDHINGDKADNRVENLRWVTQSENNANPIWKAKQREAKQSEHYKKLMNEALSGDKNGARTHREKNIFVVNNPTSRGRCRVWICDEYLGEFNSVFDASKKLGISRSVLDNVLKGKKTRLPLKVRLLA